MIIAASQIEQVAVDVCYVMLGVDTEPFVEDNPPAPKYFAYVEVLCGESAVVEVAVCETAAKNITRAMFGSEGDVEIDEVADAISELANMAGGNLKSMLGIECNLSIPTFKHQRDMSFDHRSNFGTFKCGGGMLRIAIQKED